LISGVDSSAIPGENVQIRSKSRTAHSEQSIIYTSQDTYL